jgi:hypothetical protein
MLFYHACSKCHARVRHSRLRNAFEFVICPLVIPWRCSVCDRREFKFRFLDMNPKLDEEQVSLPKTAVAESAALNPDSANPEAANPDAMNLSEAAPAPEPEKEPAPEQTTTEP